MRRRVLDAAEYCLLDVAVLTPYLRQLVTDPSRPPITSRALGEWAYRLTASLLITAGVVPTTTEDDLRRFVSSLLSLPAA